MVVNGFNILDGEMNPLGTGLYLGVSVVDHSCRPNAIATFESTTLFVRVLEDQPCLDWSKTFISYIDVMNTAENRRADLQANYYFLCDCIKCSNPIEPVRMQYAACPNAGCSAGLDLLGGGNSVVVECDKCGELVKEEYRQEFIDVMEFTKSQLISMNDVACILFKKNSLKPLS